ncbi:ATP-binding cassette subfamily B protein [Actinoalloteichus hoggarensis]|uniref:Iron import ATP-binding/permease protein IrtB n=1 Tax=Actinoalloteichus hoggarensis TaxID=1470176 RepID=A0A221W755_9PSEU|nr:ABC transporter ATP-binding protein [Actinoalloteichus hoggarensis]ASO21513.1 Iron import ATP-binding/permease protein IrtB [Actinoalloteichus hoggarensis]MBB5922102.1 ATP-binding cassette subfamily B protein [Actinoalloteichus hoggarensis]
MIRHLHALVPHPRLTLRLGALTAVQAILQGLLLGTLAPILTALMRPEPDFDSALPWLLAAGLGTVAYGVLTVIATPIGFTAASEVAGQLRNRVMQHAIALPSGWFTPENKARLARTLTADAGNIGQLAVSTGGPALTAVLTPATIVLVTATVDWRVALLLAATMPVAFLALRRAGRVSSDVERELENAAMHIAGRAIEVGQAQPVLRAAGLGRSGTPSLRAALAGHRDVYERGLRRAMVPDLTYTAVVLAGFVATVVLCVWLFVTGRVGAPETIALLILTVRFLEPLSSLIELIGALHAMDNAVTRVQEILSAKPLPSPAHPVGDHTADDVTFTGVSFAYPGSRSRAITEASFSCPAGSTTALIGPSGSGKTTVTRLLARFFDVDEGSITIGGVDVREFDPGCLRERIALVFQDVYLFDDTIEANLRLARPDATARELADAAAAARLDEVIERLPAGWHTRVGEGGSKLSGGERQRVSIARAFLKGSPIVVIDEAASALDPENERAVGDAIRRIAEDPARTVIVIAHRPATLESADQVIALDQGRVVEDDSPERLRDTGGLYSRLHDQYTAASSWRIAGAGRR